MEIREYLVTWQLGDNIQSRRTTPIQIDVDFEKVKPDKRASYIIACIGLVIGRDFDEHNSNIIEVYRL